MSRDQDYPLDRTTPTRHVATLLEKARVEDRDVSLDELAEGYEHPNPADLVRLMKMRELTTKDEATRNLLDEARQNLARWIAETSPGRYRLNRPLAGMRYPKVVDGSGYRPITPTPPDPSAELHDPFNPQSGTFAGNIRAPGWKPKDEPIDQELRESMRTFGWVEELPAVMDERGVVLIGNRRMAIAKELGITPVVKEVRLGSGDDADRLRATKAIASNLGGKPLRPTDRKYIAEHLYDADWTMAQIAQVLNTTHKTISKDLQGFVPEYKPPRPKGGRPRKSVLDPTPLSLTSEQEAQAKDWLENGASVVETAAKLDVSNQPVIRMVERERGRRETSPGTCWNCGVVLR